ncbi:MAG TPA: HAD-IC family P-type ATPase [Anaerovoracaceae bacterium]|nr:HAD-IC family P-type ATPase [Anaerovoracaceae bacterium]
MLNTQVKSERNLREVLYKRVRIYHRFLYRNDAMADSLGKYMAAQNGVQFSRANPLTGRILVIFDETVINENDIAYHIDTYIRNNVPQKESKVIELDSVRNKSRQKTAPEADYLWPEQTRQYTEESPSFHTMQENELEEILNTNLDEGLTDNYARQTVKAQGLNILSEKKRQSVFYQIIKNLLDYSTRLLIGAGIASVIVGQIADGAAILGIAALQTVISTVQQHKAECSISSLKSMMVHKTRVIRNGKEHSISTKYLAPGDVIIVESGDKIPADARIIESFSLQTTEATLTGESAPVGKSAGICGENTDLSGRHNMIFAGTSALSGRARAVVTATGMNTEIGKIAGMIQNISEDPAPIKIKINRLTKWITKAAFLFCLLIIGAGLTTGRTLAEVLIMSICFSIGAIPESLPAVVNASMALSAQRMAKKNVIARSLPAVETLGCTDVICCDKTGTLTMNEMTVKKIYTSGAFYSVSGAGYAPNGTISADGGSRWNADALERILTAGALCNNSRLTSVQGKWAVQGDSTEGALLTTARKYGLDLDCLEKSTKRVREIPFDSTMLCMTTVSAGTDGRTVCCKGAFSRISEKCGSILENGEERPFTAADKEKIQALCDSMGDETLRVLAFACKRIDNEEDDAESDFVFLGLMGMEDPPRDGARESIQKCHRAGIKVIMITGDNKNTAYAIGRRLGLLTDGIVMTGAELDELSDSELRSGIDRIQIFARTCPAHKHRIVKALKEAGHIVAMIGDGVNDTPAMKEANIAVAMGKNGSDTAKDVAGITLVDDEFTTIIDAIQEGRAVTNNVKNAIRYLLGGALGEIAAVTLAAVVFGISPLLSIQMLWVNVISETIMGSSLAVEPAGSGLMTQPPYARGGSLVSRTSLLQIIRRGMLIGLSTFGIFGGAMLLGLGLAKARTLAFVTLVLSQLLNVYRCRNNKDKRPGLYRNMAALTSAALLLGIVYYPPLCAFFKTVPLNGFDLAAVVCAAGVSRI